MPRGVRASTGDKILPELYEISRRYIDAGRPYYQGAEPADVYASAEMWLLIETASAKVDHLTSSDSATPGMVRDALLDLAMCAVAWSREIRELCP